MACDVTHVQGQAYPTLVDCASRFASWCALPDESSREVRQVLLETFAAFGPPEESLSVVAVELDNGGFTRHISHVHKVPAAARASPEIVSTIVHPPDP